MKKVLIGCGVTALLAIILVVGLVAFAGYKFVSFGTSVQASMLQLQSTNQRYAFTEPDKDALDERRLKDYFEIRKKLIAQVEASPTVQKIMDGDKSNDPGFMEFMSTVLNFTQKLTKDFVGELDTRRMSYDEYKYHSHMVYITLSDAKVKGDLELGKVFDDLDASCAKISKEMAKRPNENYQIDVETAEWSSEELSADRPTATNIELIRPYKDDLAKHVHVSCMEMILFQLIEDKMPQLTGGVAPPATVNFPAPTPAPAPGQ